MPAIDDACMPTQILWTNIGTSVTSRRLRTCANWIFALLIMCATLLGTIMFMNEMKKLSSKYNTNVACPGNSIVNQTSFKSKAFNDKLSKTNYGFMTCFCKYYMLKEPLTFRDISFEDVTPANGLNPTAKDLKIKYCADWFSVYIIN
jgi:hypothetical protein